MNRPDTMQPLPSAERACPYLEGRTARQEDYWAPHLSQDDFERLAQSGFRHFGFYYFRPRCRGLPGASHCGACLPLRVPVAKFSASQSQRRAWAHRGELRIEITRPVFDETRLALYHKHKQRFHGRVPAAGEEDPATMTREMFQMTYVNVPAWTFEFDYFLGDRLVGVGYVDLTPRVASSIYFYFDPEESRLSLGTLSALVEIDYASRLKIPYYYLGFAIYEARAMRYKMDFRPNEILDGESWVEFRDAAGNFARDPSTVRSVPFALLPDARDPAC